MYQWKKDVVQWDIGRKRYLSVVFTWMIPQAIDIIRNSKKKCFVGGPAVYTMPHKFDGIAEVLYKSPIEPLLFHNPCATFMSRGCPRKCKFCVVPGTEGELVELEEFRLAPIICDNNFLLDIKTSRMTHCIGSRPCGPGGVCRIRCGINRLTRW